MGGLSPLTRSFLLVQRMAIKLAFRPLWPLRNYLFAPVDQFRLELFCRSKLHFKNTGRNSPYFLIPGGIVRDPFLA